MEPENLRFGGGSAETLLHPLVAAALVLTVLLIFFLPRRQVLAPLLITIFLVPKGQAVVIAGAHFTAVKILFLAGLIRCAISRSLTPGGGWNSIDRVFALWAFCYPLVVTLQWMEGQALIKTIGDSVDVFCGYFVLRFLIRDAEDVRRVIKVFVVISAIMAVCMLNEHFTQHDVFGLLGGVGAISDLRDGKIRANGVFAHSILAGSFGATLLPIFLSLWTDRKSKIYVFLGVICSTTIVATSNGSTPALAYVAGLFALCLWPVRKHMRILRWGLVLILVALHLVMNGPVWSLIEKIDLTGSSSSYHRYMLMDNCIRHFGDWWLLGVKNYDTWGFDMWDLSNQYVAYAVTGGLVTIALFIAIISRSFGKLGTAMKQTSNRKDTWFLWCLGAALFGHLMAYFGIGYFDQTQIAWFALLAIIGAATAVRTKCERLSPSLVPTSREVYRCGSREARSASDNPITVFS